jgi:hypothetical protein
VFGSNLAGLVGELPRRVGQNGREAAFANEGEQIAFRGGHEKSTSRRG